MRCNACGGSFDPETEPGAIALSPPVPHQNLVKKYHVCAKCWWDKFQILVSHPCGPLAT